MRCPRCGEQAPSGDAFCAGCGHEFERTCPRCAAMNRPGARFCVECGSELTESQHPSAGTAGVEPTAHPEAFEPTATDRAGIEYEEDPGPPRWEPRRVPATGLKARNEPDPTASVATELSSGTEVLVLERRGAWARVSVESGWSGWVDDRRLLDPDLQEVPAASEEEGSPR